MTREKIVTALISGVIGILLTGFLSMLTVGSKLSALELKMESRMTRLETRLEIIYENQKTGRTP